MQVLRLGEHFCLFFSQNLTSEEKDVRSKIFSVQLDWRTISIASCNALVRACCQEKRVNAELDFNDSKRVGIFLDILEQSQEVPSLCIGKDTAKVWIIFF